MEAVLTLTWWKKGSDQIDCFVYSFLFYTHCWASSSYSKQNIGNNCILWVGFDTDARQLHTKSRESFQFPKIFGGLGIRSLYIKNWSLLLKLVWFIIANPNKWSVNCLLKKYAHNSDFRNIQAQATNSRLWRATLKTRQWLLTGSFRQINSGYHTILFHHNWWPGYNWVLLVPSDANFLCFGPDKNQDKLLILNLYDVLN